MSYQQLPNAQYDGFNAIRTHMHFNGLAMMPTAAPFPAPANVVALHGGMDFEAIGYQAIKRGCPPNVPSPITTNPNRVFLGGGRTAEFPIEDMSGTIVYVVQGWFLFGILAPEGLTSDFMLGALPFPGVDSNAYIPGIFFRTQLINTNPTQTLVNVPIEPPELRMVTQQG